MHADPSVKISDVIATLKGLENAAEEKGLKDITDAGQRIAYRWGWGHAIQEAIKAVSEVTPKP